jgi:glycosyltransferase involved in cell wall biosynthesis
LAGISTIGFIIPALTSGGAERVVAVLAGALAPDFAVHVLVQKDADPAHFAVGVAVHEVDFTHDGLTDAVTRLGIDLLLDHYHWDQTHIRLMAGLADAGIKVVLTEHNAYHYPLFQWARDVKPDYQPWFEDRIALYRKFAAVTVLNAEAYGLFSQRLDNLRLLPNPAPELALQGSDPASRRILTVSHFRKKAKRLDLMYEMFAKVRARDAGASLTVLGDYDWLHDHYCRRAAGLDHGAIEVAGRSSRVDQHFDRSALFALTSEIEGQPMVMLEAALHGMAQVSFDLPGLQDQLVHGETGLLVPFGDTDAFADAVAGLIGDAPRLKAMGEAARALVRERFALSRITDMWRALIADIARDGRVKSTKARKTKAMSRRDAEWTAHWHRIARHEGPDLPPKISFLVPVHGTEALLGRCLRSIQQQTLTEFECIIVDDGSPPYKAGPHEAGDVQSVVTRTVGDDGRFVVLRHEANRGLYQARSTAAEAARGLYFAHIDSDDYIDARFAEVMFAEALTTGAEIVECKAVELREDGRPVRFNEIRHDGPVDGAEAARGFFNNSLRNVVWNKIYSRDLWWRVPGHNAIDAGLTICEDVLRNSLLFPECRRYSAVTDCLYIYCRRPGSVVKGGDLGRLLAKLRDVEFAYSTAKAHHGQPGQSAVWGKLDDRQTEDVQWYLGEYLGRHDPAELRAEIRRLGDGIDAMTAVALVTVRQWQAEKAVLARMAQALKWEQARAAGLEKKLSDLRRLIGN